MLCVFCFYDIYCLHLRIKSNKMNKITEEELSKLSSLKMRSMEVKSHVADMALFLKRATEDMDVCMMQLQECQAELQAKYGDVKINLQTGEYDTKDNDRS